MSFHLVCQCSTFFCPGGVAIAGQLSISVALLLAMGDRGAVAMQVEGLPPQPGTQTSIRRPAGAPAVGEPRTKSRHYDLLPAQMLNPMGSSGLEVVSDQALWCMLCEAKQKASVFAEICLEEPERRAVALSRFAQVYCEAIRRFKDNQYTRSLLKESVYDKIIEEADDMLELLSTFNRGESAQRQLSSMRSVAYGRAAASARHEQKTMEQASQELHQWLSKKSLLRSFMSYRAGGGCHWSAYAHERAVRCFLSVGQGSQQDIARAVRARLA